MGTRRLHSNHPICSRGPCLPCRNLAKTRPRPYLFPTVASLRHAYGWQAARGLQPTHPWRRSESADLSAVTGPRLQQGNVLGASRPQIHDTGLFVIRHSDFVIHNSCPLASPAADPILPDRLKVSFLIPLRDGYDLTRSLYGDLGHTLPPDLEYEIIFVDNASSDCTRAWLRSLTDPRVRIIENAANLGYARANNQAAAIARGEFLCLLNNDLVLLPGWFEPLMKAGESESKSLVGNVQLSVRTRQVDHAGIFFDPAGSPYHFRPPLRFLFPPRSIAAPALTGACLLVRRQDYQELGGLDEQFVNSYEDVDFCLRAGQQGFVCRVALASIVFHYIGATVGRQDAESANATRFLARWKPLLPAPAFPPPRVPVAPSASAPLKEELAQYATLQAYHPRAEGLSELESTLTLFPVDRWSDLGFPLPQGLQNGATCLRIDPCHFPAEIQLRSFRLVDPQFQVCLEIEQGDQLAGFFQPGGTIARFTADADLHFISTGEDPQLNFRPSAVPPELAARKDLRAELSLRVHPLPEGTDHDPQVPPAPVSITSGAQPLRVAVDLRLLEAGGSHGGVKPQTFGLLQAVGKRHPNRFSFTYFLQPSLTSEVESIIRPVDTGVCLGPADNRTSERIKTIPALPSRWRSEWPADLLYSPLGASDLCRPDLPWISQLVDTLHRELPGALPPAEIPRREHEFRQVLDQADAIHCISEYVRTQLLRYYAADPDRLFVIPNSVPENLVELAETGTVAAPTTDPYFFYPANDWPHKNHTGLLRAFREYRDLAGSPGWHLVLAGYFHRPDLIEGQIRALRLGAACHIAGFVDPHTFAGIFGQSGALIFPSLHEGFGVPVIEAMALGVPIACSHTASLPEVAGDAALFFDPTDPAEIARAMFRMSSDEALRLSLIEAGRKRASRYSVADAADRLAEQFERVARRQAVSS